MKVLREVKVGDHRIQLASNRAGGFQTRIIAGGNNETILPTEGYEAARDAVKNLEQLRDILAEADLKALLRSG